MSLPKVLVVKEDSPLASKFVERDFLRRRLEEVEAEIVLHSQRQQMFADLIYWMVVRHLDRWSVKGWAVGLAALAGGFFFACMLDLIWPIVWIRPTPILTGLIASLVIVTVAMTTKLLMKWSWNALLADGVIEEHLQHRLAMLLTTREKFRRDLEEVQRQIAETPAGKEAADSSRDQKSS